jgi:hypothetical protein
VRESQEEEMMENKLYAELDRAANRIRALEAALLDIAKFDDSECEMDRIMRFRWRAVDSARAALGSEKTAACSE